MQSNFKPNRLAISDEEFFADLRRVATLLGTRRLSLFQYGSNAKYSPHLCRRFGGWSKAMQKAGLRPFNRRDVTAEQLIADIQLVAKQLNVTSLTRIQYWRAGSYSTWWIERLFVDWQSAAAAAGVTCSSRRRFNSADELLLNLKQLWHKLQREPTAKDLYTPQSICGPGPYTRHFGSWHKALIAFNELYADAESPAQSIALHQRLSAPRVPASKLRYRILQRDHFRCQACGKSPATDAGFQLHIDHILPWSQGGQTTPENLRTLCQDCNTGKGDTREES